MFIARACCKALYALFIFGFILALSGEAFAQTINAIEVRGNRRIDGATIQAYLPLRIGDEYNEATADKALKTLFSTGLFSDIKIRRNGRKLIVEVVENPIISQVAFEGNDVLDEDVLKPLINVVPRAVYSRAQVLAAAQVIIQQYRRQGYYRVRVEPKVIELPSHRVNVVFEVTEGEKSYIEAVYFIGNKVFSDYELKSSIASGEYAFWKFLSVTDTYDPDRLEFDKQLLRSFYTKRGFADFAVQAVLAERNITDNGFYITFIIDEGKRYRFGKNRFRIKIPELDKDIFEPLMQYDTGDIFNGYRIGLSRDAITEEMQNLGYVFLNVTPDLEKNSDTQIANVIWHITETPRSYLERIEIKGNSHTQDEVVRREFRLKEGDPFNLALMAQSERAIRNLGFFNNVAIDTRQGSTPDKVILDARVAERPTGEISLGAGFSTIDGFIADFSIRETNFQGKGQTLGVAFSYAERRQNVNLSFVEPYFFGYRLRFGIGGFYQINDLRDTQGYNLDRTGASLSLRFPLREDAYFTLSYELQNDRIYNSDGNFEEGDTLESIFGYRLSYDRRDDIRTPSSGWYASFGQDFAGAGGQASYVRTIGDIRFYRTLADVISGKYIFASRLLGGHLYPLGDYEPRTLNNFFLGAGNVRGFDRSGVGPRRASGTSVGGRLYGILSNELRISSQYLKQVGLTPVLFLDTAIVGDSGSDTRRYYAVRNDPIRDNFALRISAGFSLLWESPLGPLRFDFADVLLKESYDDEQNFHFQIGVSF